ncbi:gamma-aminobutyric acid receptor subunit pi [Syngnathus acus]|uniref:gamma-aminobutyric acid receptor subunit pi n=1 Tax=Syngnathus acus TaxID=161584 RepID=UPI0018861B40|nr:gamma-aminobutyric acid receptor subunit pi [Syngnathus acus]XP_037117568.1 gamma-aminobutyric acid receptor subunit pi [Syngnathus acus]XP_037117569.1 gamma-aminobutyric acid receptor subunit pi [Syngnathus acus]XP_061136200.1 gamma-aminobutyric acid receptor subunit pi [Syngnathus typhle]
MFVQLSTPLIMCLTFTLSACMFPGHNWGEWNDSQLLPTIQKLMKGYNRYLRPNFNEGPVEIGMSLDIASIDAISEINMDYTATIFLRQRWRDSRLVFPGNESVSVDGRLVSLLWIPDTFIPDSKRSFLHDVTVENRLIRIFSNGTVLYALRITATIACNMDLTKYPMDRQVCTLQLESWGYNLQDVVFYWTRGNDSVRGLDTLRLAQYSVESYYTSVSEAVYETGQYPKLVLHFALRRNVLFFILETYVPSTLLVVLSWVSFWISQSSVPARTCIGVTTVLTMTTLMMGARTSLPNANCFIKAIDVYLGICFTFIFGALLEYACAHFYTMQHQTIEDLHRDLVREFNESSGNGSIPVVSSTQPKDPVKVSSADEEPTEQSSNSDTKATGEPKQEKKGQGCSLSSVKNASKKAVSIFIVENPHNIDRHARTVFPMAFLFVNILYWLYYLFH